MTLADTITAMSALLAALSFVWGVSAWRREFVGKRRIDLAESVLAKFYEAADAIRDIRNPFAGADEGSTRKRGVGESSDQTEILDRSYVVWERYQKREELFSELRAMKYRFMAAFGKPAGEPFDAIHLALHEIFVAARMLGTHHWPRQGRAEMTQEEFRAHLEKLHKYERVFWKMSSEDDVIDEKVATAVAGIEEIASRAASMSAPPGWWAWFHRRSAQR